LDVLLLFLLLLPLLLLVIGAPTTAGRQIGSFRAKAAGFLVASCTAVRPATGDTYMW
jgi:hypothetical protein